jgi:hypothetical protein
VSARLHGLARTAPHSLIAPVEKKRNPQQR